MNIKELKQIMKLVSDFNLAEFEWEREGEKLTLKKYSSNATVQAAPMAPMPMPESPGEAASAPDGGASENSDEGLHLITSPIVGTFYGAPAPDADPFVRKGSKVSPDDTVCIIEAMKVMNEIKADVSGTIEEVVVENGQAIEFGQVLFKVRPS